MRPLLDIRQFLDTRGGLATTIVALATTIGLSGFVGLIQPAIQPDSPVQFGASIFGAIMPLSIVLPIVAVFIIASDWSNGSAQTTFLQRPARGQVLVSKIVAVLVISTVLTAVGLLSAWAATAAGGAIGDHGASYADAGASIRLLVISSATVVGYGIAVASLLQGTALALVAALAVPFVVSLPAAFVYALAPEWAQQVFALIDLSTAATNLAAGDAEVTNVLCLVLLIAVPLVFGTLRWQRREVA